MADVNQYFSDPELESIINNATEKPVTASSSGGEAFAILIIVIGILYAIATIMELVRFIQTSNKLHLLLFISSLTVIVVAALRIANRFHADTPMYELAPFIFLVISWILLIIPTYLLYIWVRSMLDRFHKSYRQYFKFVKACLILFTLTKLTECIVLIIYMRVVEENRSSYYWDHYYYDQESARGYSKVLFAKLVIEFILVCYPGLSCIGIRHEFRGIIDPELSLKRRQLTRIFLLYLVQFLYFQ
jgi:hypothetical protein